MIWKGRRESDNVVDQRSLGAGTMGGGALLIGALIYYLMGGNPLVYLAQNADQVQTRAPASVSEEQNEQKSFASVVLADTEDVWSSEFEKMSRTYTPPKMVLFRGAVNSGCGRASVATGPFYCPSDQRVYLDLSFFDELSRKLGAKGDFAAAYVIAHEVGHHVQTLLGLEGVASHQQNAFGSGKNQASIRIELQADCLAGVWAKQTERTKHVLEEGDIDEALNAASAVGDDRLQQRSQGYVVPDSFTHGTSEQRQSAFRRGYEGGELKSCVD